MLKGAQKKMIVVKTGDSKVFEEAYFVIRSDALCPGGDMVGEANKIIDRCGAQKKDRRINRLSLPLISLCSFMGGSLFGGAIAFLVTLA